MSRVLETVLTGRNLLSPVLAKAGSDVVAFNSTVAGANEKAAAGSAASARAQQAASTQVVQANTRVATSATTTATTQVRAHTQVVTSAQAMAAAETASSAAVVSANSRIAGAVTGTAATYQRSAASLREKLGLQALDGAAADRSAAANSRAAASAAVFSKAIDGNSAALARDTGAAASSTAATRANTVAREQATLAARAQQAATNSLAASNGLLGTSLTPLTAGLGGTALALGYAGYRGMEFGTAMSQVQAASQETGAVLGDLRDAAIEAGADTQYSAVEAAQGITEMSKAGVAAKDILGGGLTGALNLAAAGQISVAEAAETGATALSVFGLKGDQMSHVADLLAAGAGKAQGSVGDMSAALNQSALVADQAGLSIEDTAGALAMFASNGLLGSDAGTSFKTMLQALTPNSEKAARVMEDMGLSAFDAQGNFVGLEAYAGQLQTALAGLTEEQRNSTLETIFGSDAVRAASVLYKEGAAGVAEWAAKVNDAGFASRQAAQLNDNLRGDLERLGGAVDSFFTSLGDGAQGPLREVVQMLTGLVNGVGWVVDAFGSLPGPLQTAIVAFGAMAALRGPVSGAFEKMTDSVLGWSLANDRASLSTGGLRGAATGLLGMFGGPWGLAISGAVAGVSLLSSVLGSSSDSSDAAASSANNLTSALEQTKGAIDDTVRSAAVKDLQDSDLLEWAEKTGVGVDAMVNAMLGVPGAAEEVGTAFDRYINGQRDDFVDSTGAIVTGFTEQGFAARDARDTFEDLTGKTSDTIAKQEELVTATEAAGGAMEASTAQTEEAARALQDWLEALQGVAEGFVDPLAAYKGLLEEKTTAEREAAEATAASTEDSSDSWKDYVTDVDVSLDELADRLAEQIENQENWRTNIGQIAAWAGVDVAQHLAQMGQEGVGLVAQMADGSSTEAQRMADLIREDIRLGGMEWTGAMDAEMKNVEAIAAAGGRRTAAGLAYELGIGVDQVAAIASRYGIVLADGINPLLGALGARTVSIQQRGARPNSGSLDRPGFFDGGYTGDGGKYDVAGVVHAGEFVVPKHRVDAMGGPHAVGSLVGMPGYADGGFVTAADVPRPRSTAPYQPPISTAGDATMQKGFDEVRAWLTANAEQVYGGTAGGGSVGGAWGSLWQLVKSQIPQARINSTFRPGDPGYHGLGKAIDFGYGTGPGGAGSAGLASINRLLHDQVGRNLAELIYDGIGDDRPDLKHGKPLTYSAATRAQHTNHVHAAVADVGGVMGSGTAHLNLSGRPERTLSPEQTEAFERWMAAPAAMPGYGMSGGGEGHGGATRVELSLKEATITGRLELGTDGLVTLVDGRITDVLTYAGTAAT